jgi:hypothetical protein
MMKSAHSLPPMLADQKGENEMNGDGTIISFNPRPYEERRREILVDLLTYYRGGEVIVLFLVHPDLTLQAFSIFACKQIGINSDR